MRSVSLRLVFGAALWAGVTFVATAWGADGNVAGVTSNSDAWYKIVTGVIAIPAALIGLLVSFNVLRKTTLESRKLELEIQEKQTALSNVPRGEERLEDITRPVTESQRAILLLVRFVVLDLTIRLWDVVPFAVNSLTGSLPYLILFTLGERRLTAELGNLTPSSPLIITAFLLPRAVSFGLSLVYWLIVFGFGWPLLKDTCRFLNIPINSLVDLPYLGRANRPRPQEGP